MKFILALAALSLLVIAVEAKLNFKKDYCGNKEYVGIGKRGHAHLHCGDNWMVFTSGGGKHKDLVKKNDVRCSAINEITPDEYENESEDDRNAITAVLNSLKADYDCKKLTFLQHLFLRFLLQK